MLRRIMSLSMFGVMFSCVQGARAQNELSWQISRIDERVGFMHSCSLAATSNGTVFVSYAVADTPPSPNGQVNVAIRSEQSWTRELVSTTLGGFGTSIAVNPVTQQPGVVFLNTSGGIEFWERAGYAWASQPVSQFQNQTWLTLAYDESGRAVLGRTLRAELDGAPYFFGHLEMRTGGLWHAVPLPVQGDYLNPITHGSNTIVSSLAAQRGSSSLRFVDLMRGLPDDSSVEVVDALPPESISGEIQLRQVPLAADQPGNIYLAHLRHFETQDESISELRFARVPPLNPIMLETVLGGGAIQDPSAFALAEGFASQMCIAVTPQGKPYVFGTSRGFDQINYAVEQNGMWFQGAVDSAPSVGGNWRTTGSVIDPESGLPIVAYAKGPSWRSDTSIYLATPQIVLGDLDGNQSVDAADIEPFVSVLLGLDVALPHQVSADLNGDGFADGEDLQPFVNALIPSKTEYGHARAHGWPWDRRRWEE